MEKASRLFNRYLLTQFNLDSGALTMLGVVMHNFSEPGLYQATVLQGEQEVGSFVLQVDEKSPATQVDIDLARLKSQLPQPCCDEATRADYVVGPRGYAVFHVSDGPGGFAVVVGRGRRERAGIVFDSRKLQEGDLFAATLLRPGAYAVTNEGGHAKADLVIAYPKRTGERYVQPEPAQIQVTADGILPRRIDVQSAQSQVYQMKAPGRLRIELVRPDDGPGEPRRRYRTWGEGEEDRTQPRSPGTGSAGQGQAHAGRPRRRGGKAG